MKAFVLDRYARKGALRPADIPPPDLGDDEVLVEVHAASVNPLDSKLRDGEFKLILPYPMPLVLGHDVAGVVVRVGAKVRQFKPGDEVYSRPDDFRIGAFAELIAIKASSVAHKPKGLTMVEAASIPLVGLTAWQALVEKPGFKRGRRFLSRQARAAWAPSPSSWPSIWAPPWPPPPARAMPHWSRAWARMWSLITRRRTLKTCCATTTWSCTARMTRPWPSLCVC